MLAAANSTCYDGAAERGNREEDAVVAVGWAVVDEVEVVEMEAADEAGEVGTAAEVAAVAVAD